MTHHATNPEDLFLTRRQLLSRCGMGMAGVALNGVPALVAAAARNVPDWQRDFARHLAAHVELFLSPSFPDPEF